MDMASRVKRRRMKKRLPKGSVFNDRLAIGEGSRVNGPIVIKGEGACSIGKYSAFGADIKIITSNHAMDTANIQIKLQRRIGARSIAECGADVQVGHNVWIGDSVIILPGVSIGDGAVIGAGAIITKDVLPFSVVVGAPAKELKKRFSNQIVDELLQIKWWFWDEDRMRRNRDFFDLNLAEYNGESLLDIIKP